MKITKLIAMLLGILIITPSLQAQPNKVANSNFTEKLKQNPELIKDLVQPIYESINSLANEVNRVKQESYSNLEQTRQYSAIAESAIKLKLIINSLYRFIILNIKMFPRVTWKILKENLDSIGIPLNQTISELEQIIGKIKIESPGTDRILIELIQLKNFNNINKYIIESTRQIVSKLESQEQFAITKPTSATAASTGIIPPPPPLPPIFSSKKEPAKTQTSIKKPVKKEAPTQSGLSEASLLAAKTKLKPVDLTIKKRPDKASIASSGSIMDALKAGLEKKFESLKSNDESDSENDDNDWDKDDEWND